LKKAKNLSYMGTWTMVIKRVNMTQSTAVVTMMEKDGFVLDIVRSQSLLV
jgi:hypothetical protein